MRLFLFALLNGLMLATALQADEAESGFSDPLAGVPAPLREAVGKAGRDLGRWAFTVRTISRDRKGRVTEDTVARYDPSQHYDVQWTLLKKNGKDATEGQIKKHRKQRVKLEKNRQSLGELLDLKQARLVEDAPEALTYVVPVRQEDNGRFPVDKVEVLVRVRADRHELESIELRLREAVRAAVVAKVKRAGAMLYFDQVKSEFSPALTRIKADLSASVALIPVEQHTEQMRTEFKRVTPYDERFNVQIGSLKAIDF
jgi:hypothetical protein